MHLYAQIEQLFASYDLRIVYAFGSKAEQLHAFILGIQSELDLSGSDIDLAVLPKDGKTFRLRSQIELGCEIEDLLGISGVDMVNLNQAPPALAAQAVMGIVLWTDDLDLESEYQLLVLRKYSDALPLDKERAELIIHHQGA